MILGINRLHTNNAATFQQAAAGALPTIDPTHNPANQLLSNFGETLYSYTLKPVANIAGDLGSTIAFAPFAKEIREAGPKTPRQAAKLKQHDELVATLKNPAKLVSHVKDAMTGAANELANRALSHSLPILQAAGFLVNPRRAFQQLSLEMGAAQSQLYQTAEAAGHFSSSLYAGENNAWGQLGSLLGLAGSIALQRGKNISPPGSASRGVPQRAANFKQTMLFEGWGIQNSFIFSPSAIDEIVSAAKSRAGGESRVRFSIPGISHSGASPRRLDLSQSTRQEISD